VDGNFGATAGIAEMLLQSHGDVLRLLPALPSEWSSGRVHGLRARGGFTVSMSWSDGRLTEASIDASVDGPCRVSTEGLGAVLLDGKPVRLSHTLEGVVEFETRAGSSYRLTFEGR
jgi:alpha-L-fucosidase 2